MIIIVVLVVLVSLLLRNCVLQETLSNRNFKANNFLTFYNHFLSTRKFIIKCNLDKRVYF